MNLYNIALTLVSGLGPKTIRQLFKLVNNAEELFSMSHTQLSELFTRHHSIIQAIESKTTMHAAEKIAGETERYGIEPLFFTDPAYPQRLNRDGCEDNPVLLFRLGKCDLNPRYSVAIVGSRKATDYGRTTASRLVKDLSAINTLIVSGLAYGIDTVAHAASVSCQTPTVAVLGHGLDIIYPSQNRNLAKQILESGGSLLTEYPLHTEIKATNFPARNRIIAALSDATVVVEAAERGGALITANIASSYNKEVFAVPGRLSDVTSQGCNNLIANNKAVMIRNAGDIFFQMGWDAPFDQHQHKAQQQSLFEALDSNQQVIVDLLEKNSEMTLDEIEKQSDMSLPKIASAMIELELKNIVRCLPGKMYKLS